MKSRDNAVSVFKFFASILVVYMHTSPLHAYSRLLNYFMINYFGRVAVLFFFVTTGFYLFRKNVNTKRILTYLKKSITLYVVWMIIYVPVFVYEGGLSRPKDIIEVFIHKFLLNDTHLWYLEASIIGVTIVYILGKMFRGNMKKVFYISLPFAIIGVLLLSYQGLMLRIPFIKESAMAYYSCFGEAPNAILVGFPYIALGAMLGRIDIPDKKKIDIGLILSLSALFFEVTIIGFLDCAGGSQEAYFFSIPAAGFIFLFFKNTQIGNSSVCDVLGSISADIYFVHQIFRAIYRACVPSSISVLPLNGFLCFVFTTLFSLIFAFSMHYIKKYKGSRRRR